MSALPPNTDDFRRRLTAELADAEERGETHRVITAGELHDLVGGYRGTNNHRMPECCSAMRAEKRDRDEVIYSPPSGRGAKLEIRYRLPR